MARDQGDNERFATRTDRLIDKRAKYKEELNGFKNWANNLSSNSLYMYMKQIINFLDSVNKPVDALSLDDYVEYRKHNRSGVAYSSIKKFAQFLIDSNRSQTDFMFGSERLLQYKKNEYVPYRYRDENLSDEDKKAKKHAEILIEKHKEYSDELAGFRNWYKNLSPKTLYYYLVYIVNFLSVVNKPTDSLNQEDYESYAEEQLQFSFSNRVSKYSAIKKFAEYLFDNKISKVNFMERAEHPKHTKGPVVESSSEEINEDEDTWWDTIDDDDELIVEEILDEEEEL